MGGILGGAAWAFMVRELCLFVRVWSGDFFSAGARVGSESNIYVRVLVGGFSLVIYIILFFFRGY